MRNFMDLLKGRWAQGKFLCVGLDSDLSKVRPLIGSEWSVRDVMNRFNAEIIGATAEHACAFKPNRAFYAALGEVGVDVLRCTIQYIHRRYPEIPVILDAKEGDIDNTNIGYVEEAFDVYGADAITVHPFLGGQALRPFLDCSDKGIIVLCRTSNKGADEFQDQEVKIPTDAFDYLDKVNAQPRSFGPNGGFTSFSNNIAYRVSQHWNQHGNCCVVVGATAPEQLVSVRRIVGNMPVLIPGVGAQGGDLEAVVKAGQDENGEGMIINVSRSLIFASTDPKNYVQATHDEAKRLHDLINQYRKTRS